VIHFFVQLLELCGPKMPSKLVVKGRLVNSKVTRTGTEPLFKVKSFFDSTMVMNYDAYLEIDQDSDSGFPGKPTRNGVMMKKPDTDSLTWAETLINMVNYLN
jgi:hypothetical protein